MKIYLFIIIIFFPSFNYSQIDGLYKYVEHEFVDSSVHTIEFYENGMFEYKKKISYPQDFGRGNYLVKDDSILFMFTSRKSYYVIERQSFSTDEGIEVSLINMDANGSNDSLNSVYVVDGFVMVPIGKMNFMLHEIKDIRNFDYLSIRRDGFDWIEINLQEIKHGKNVIKLFFEKCGYGINVVTGKWKLPIFNKENEIHRIGIYTKQ